jgi:lipid-binding SYLF domain-containing protein
VIISIAGAFLAGGARADTAKQININVDAALKLFAEVKGTKSIIKKANGLLVFPKVVKAGIGIGGEYGEGALRIKGRTVDYYSTAAASIGLQLGVQQKTIIIAFMDKGALKKFRESSGWKVGVDASIAVITIGAGGAVDTASANKPIVAFVFDQKGLMYNLTLEGSKISKLKK